MKKNYRNFLLFLFTVIPAMVITSIIPAFAAEQDMFDIYSLSVEGKIHCFVTGNFDGDELVDIAIVYSPDNDQYTRYLGLYLQKASAGFRPRADYLQALSNSAAQIDVADIDRDDIDEVLIMDANGISKIDYVIDSGLTEPRRIINQNTIFSMPYSQGIMAEAFTYEITDNPGKEIILPLTREYAIFGVNDDGSYGLLNRLVVPLASHFPSSDFRDFSSRRKHTLSLEVPDIYVIDGNLDGRNDLYFLWDTRFCSFLQHDDGTFSLSPDQVLDFGQHNSTGYVQSYLADCNGDRHPDIVMTSTSGGITSTETSLRIYQADSKGKVSPEFKDEISLSDSHSNLIVNDFDGDNIPEIVIPAVEMGTFAATKIFLTKKANLHLLIYSLRDGTLKNEPDRRLKYEFKFNFDENNPTCEVFIDWTGNYNADGYRDAAFCDGEGRILFYWGNEKQYLSQNPDLEINLDHPSGVHPVHLNTGRYSDLIVEHNLGNKYDRLTVLKNKSNQL